MRTGVDLLRQQQPIAAIFLSNIRKTPPLRRYDSILLLKGGHIAEQGSFDALMEKKGDFCALYTAAH